MNIEHIRLREEQTKLLPALAATVRRGNDLPHDRRTVFTLDEAYVSRPWPKSIFVVRRVLIVPRFLAVVRFDAGGEELPHSVGQLICMSEQVVIGLVFVGRRRIA